MVLLNKRLHLIQISYYIAFTKPRKYWVRNVKSPYSDQEQLNVPDRELHKQRDI